MLWHRSRPWILRLRSAGWLLVAGLAAACATAPAPSAPPGTVSVTHAEPDRLEAGRLGPPESEAARRAWVDALSAYLAERSAAALPEGQRLDVHLRRVQRAGAFESWRGPQAGEVRIVRDIYPPRIELDFRLRGADGRVLREGARTLSDTAFLMRPNLHPRDDPLRHEKALIDDWVRQEFGARRG